MWYELRKGDRTTVEDLYDFRRIGTEIPGMLILSPAKLAAYLSSPRLIAVVYERRPRNQRRKQAQHGRQGLVLAAEYIAGSDIIFALDANDARWGKTRFVGGRVAQVQNSTAVENNTYSIFSEMPNGLLDGCVFLSHAIKAVAEEHEDHNWPRNGEQGRRHTPFIHELVHIEDLGTP